MLERWAREPGSCKDSQHPISSTVLKGLSATWNDFCSSDYEFALFHAESLVAFWFLVFF